MQTPLRLYPHPLETIEGAGQALRAGRTTCAAILEHCFQQIDRWDDQVHAWVFIDRAAAMLQARALDAELAQGQCRGPLHGIPFGIKDIIDVQGMPTACGFAPWRNQIAEQDAKLVTALRQSGAVILGKTVTTQFAWIDPPITRNPWNLDRTPGGSSSGSAVAVATGMCLAALGSQTGGSIIRPASFCGISGYKPSYHTLNEDGIFPLAPSFDHPGFLARTIDDIRLIESIPLPHVLLDDLQIPAPSPSQVDPWVKGLLSPRSSPPRLLRPRGFFDRRAETDTLNALDQAVAILEADGAKVLEFPDPLDFEAILGSHRLMMSAEAAALHETRFSELRSHYSKHIAKLIEEGLQIKVTDYIRSSQQWNNSLKWLDGILLTPATVGPAPDASTTGNPCMNSPFSYLGWPTITFPIGLSPDALPLGIQMSMDPGRNEEDLLQTASWCQSVIQRAANAGSA